MLTIDLCLAASDSDATKRSFSLAMLRVCRELGDVVRYSAELVWDTAKSRNQFDQQLSCFTNEPTSVSVSFKGEPLFPKLNFVLTGVSLGTGTEAPVLEASGSKVDRSLEEDDPYIPRYRVHQAKNIKQLLSALKNVAHLSEPVAQELENMTFTDTSNACVIQAGISDWHFFERVLSHASSHQQGSDRKLPVLTGSITGDSAGSWVVTWGDQDAYDSGDIEQATIDDSDYYLDSFETCSIKQGNFHSLHPEFACATRVSGQRTFDIAVWQKELWIDKDFPFFSASGALVWKLEDEITQDGRNWQWLTRLTTLPKGVSRCGRGYDVPFVTWSGLGTVKEAPEKGPWLSVELMGFEPKANQAKAKLLTPYSGPSGKEGLHFVPDTGTQVQLVFVPFMPQSATEIHALLVATGNIRQEETQIKSPSIFITNPLTYQLDKQQIDKIGDVEVGCDLTTNVNGAIETNSGSNATSIKGGATQIVLSNGEINLA